MTNLKSASLRKKLSLLTFFCMCFAALYAQDLIWTGKAGDGQFFNEKNWKEAVTGIIPQAGTINPNKAINRNLIIRNYPAFIGGNSGMEGNIVMGRGNLSVSNASLKLALGYGIDMGNTTNKLLIDSAVVSCSTLRNCALMLNGNSKLYLMAANPLDRISRINFGSYDAWTFAPTVNARLAVDSLIPNISVLGTAFSNNINATLTQYYYGVAIKAYHADYKPLRIYGQENFAGNRAEVGSETIYADAAIPNNLNKKTSSFILKKGYMVTFAAGSDGTGLSRVYIASESDLSISALPAGLNHNISFIRVLPWSWVNKKGTGGDVKGVDASWYYNWGTGGHSGPDREYAAMTWGKSAIDSKEDENKLIAKNAITHIMSFNEPDDCKGQSGQYGSLCVVDTAVIYHRNLMKTGLRIVSPSCRENEERVWVKKLNALAVPLNIRMDVIGMHWYDWGGKPAATPDEDPVKIFERFKAKVNACYNYYKMPIWITEFNANKFRTTHVQDEFLKLALPWLESTWFVERYAYFQPFGGNGKFFDAAGKISSTGMIYLNQVSTPSIREEDYNRTGNNLQMAIDSVLLNDENHSDKRQTKP